MKKENQYVTNPILKFVEKRPLCWGFKVHGSGYSKGGIPDVVGNVGPFALYLECKYLDGVATPLQRRTLEKIRATGAVGGCVWSLEEAIEVIEGLEALVAELPNHLTQRLLTFSPSIVRSPSQVKE